MLPDTAELCPKTRAQWSAGYRAPGQGVQDLEAGREAAQIWVLEGHPREEGRAFAKVQWYERMKEGCSDFH